MCILAISKFSVTELVSCKAGLCEEFLLIIFVQLASKPTHTVLE